MNTHKGLWLGLFLLAAIGMRAEVLVKFDFTGYDGLQEQTKPEAKSVADHLKVSAIKRSPIYRAPENGSSFLESSMGFVPTVSDGALEDTYSVATAVEKGAYFEITLTVAPGYKLTIDSIQLGTKRASKKTGPNYFVLRSNQDDFSKDIADGETAGEGYDVPRNVTLQTFGELSDLRGEVVLRFYGWGRDAWSTKTGLWAIANHSEVGGLVIEGTVR